jgi:uncharacterized oxidoreductase
MTKLEVRGAPSYYACHEGSLNDLENLLLLNSINHCLVIHGERSLKAAASYFPNMSDVKLTFVPYQGECSINEVQRISTIVSGTNIDAIIGIGGGKVLDLTKAVAHETNTETILIPTLASTCSAWTPLSVFYTEEGEFTHYTLFPKSSLIVLIEPRIILHSPIKYVRAGIADTLAKWYEADVLIRDLQDLPLPVKIAHQNARLCQIVLLEHSQAALKAMEAKTSSPAFLQVIETIIVAGGIVGGFGDRYGRIAAAHSVHNGLTVAYEAHHLLHGEKVAYGILVQLVLEENLEEVATLLPFYKALELPILLSDLGLNHNDLEKLKAIAVRTVASGESIHYLEKDFSSDDILTAILTLETFVQPLV